MVIASTYRMDSLYLLQGSDADALLFLGDRE